MIRTPSSAAAGLPKCEHAIGRSHMPIGEDSMPRSGQTLRTAFEKLIAAVEQRNLRYAVIGGIAAVHHTRIRATDDIDLLLIVPQVAMPGFFELLRDQGFSLDVFQSVRDLQKGLATIRFQDVVVDLMLPALPLYTHVLDRALTAEVLGKKVRISSAEGLAVMKVISMRPQDEIDIRELLIAYAEKLDIEFIRSELSSVLTADEPRMKRFDLLVQEQSTQD
jgi:hypothetical protein